MATKKSQRIGILIIAFIMLVGTVGSLLAVVLSMQNTATDQQRMEQLEAEYQSKVDKQRSELSEKYYGEFVQFSDRVGEFDAEGIEEVKTEDLEQGDGEELEEDTAYSAYYIGWKPDGEIFDQSIEDGKLRDPLPGGSMIEGWNEGILGMKVGGVREITIPSDKAYGEAGRDNIPPNTPLKFVVMIIPAPEEVPMPDELLDYYMSFYL